MIVGAEESTSTLGGAGEVEVEAAVAVVVVVALSIVAAGVTPGVGLPSRLPEPEKGTYFFLDGL